MEERESPEDEKPTPRLGQEDTQKESYRAAIESFVENSVSKSHHDIDSDIYEKLMDGTVDKSQSETDSMLQASSPFDNSFTRQEVDMVVSTFQRKNSMNSMADATSPLLPNEEKKVNISNLSDLIPEEVSQDKFLELNEEEQHPFNRVLRPGELNEVVEEVDEDISDDVLSSPRRDREIKEALPQSIHQRTDSNTVLDVQTSDRTRKAS